MKRYITYLVLLVGIVCANAQTRTTQLPGQPAIQSQQIMSSGTKYSGPVYTPFDNTVPSEQTYSGAQKNNPFETGKQGETIRKDFDTGAESGQSEEFPIGEPYVLALFALLFSAFIAYRRKTA